MRPVIVWVTARQTKGIYLNVPTVATSICRVHVVWRNTRCRTTDHLHRPFSFCSFQCVTKFWFVIFSFRDCKYCGCIRTIPRSTVCSTVHCIFHVQFRRTKEVAGVGRAWTLTSPTKLGRFLVLFPLHRRIVHGRRGRSFFLCILKSRTCFWSGFICWCAVFLAKP